MITPPFLTKGDKIGLIAPAGKLQKNHKIYYAIKIFESWGLEIVKGKYLFSEHNSFAAKDKERAIDLQNMLNDKNIKAIFCARGGYGCTRIIDSIDFSIFEQQPKWIIGYSDITALLCHINNLGVEGIHGLMPAAYENFQSREAIEGIRKILFGEQLKVSSTIPHQLNRIGIVKAEVVGGNLSLINDLIGTSSDINTDNKILFIEEIEEYVYHIDRMMTHLKRAGKLKNLAGLVVGYISNVKKNETNPFGQTAQEVIAEKVKEYNFPLCFNFPIGHEPNNQPVICGGRAKLEVNNNGGLISFIEVV